MSKELEIYFVIKFR